jgi:hypothetical protein
VTLQPTPDTRLSYVERSRRQQAWGWTTAGVGTGLAAAATVFVIVNGKSLDDAKKKRSEVDATFAKDKVCDPAGPGDPMGGHDACLQHQADAYNKVNDYELRRTIGLVGLGVGAAGMVTGLILLITNDNPHKYDHPESELAITPLGWVDGSGGFRLGFQARF